MSKRSAAFQISQLKPEEDEEDELPMEAPVATAEVLATRKILQPRRRLGDAGTKSAFGSPSTPAANPLAAFKKPLAPDSTPVQSSDSNDPEFQKFLKLRALNEKFTSTISESIAKDALADLSNVCQKYIDFCVSIGLKSYSLHSKLNSESKPSKPFAFSASNTPISASTPFGFALNDQQADDTPLKPQQPLDNAAEKPQSPFKFGAFTTKPAAPEEKVGSVNEPKADEIVDADADDVMESDNNNSQPQNTSSTETEASKLNNTWQPSNGLSFAHHEAPANTVTFSPAVSTTPASKPIFGFSAQTKSTADSSKEPAKETLFTFKSAGTNDNVTSPEAGMPSNPFKYSGTLNTSSSEASATQASPFKFGATDVDANTKSSDSPAKPVFSFGAPGAKSTDDSESNEKPTTSGFTPIQSTSATGTPGFTFTPKTDQPKTTSAFSFAQSADKPVSTPTPAPTFTFGLPNKPSESTSSEEKTGKDEKTEVSPFKFGSTATQSVPAFSFGTTPAESSTEAKPAFSFRSGSVFQSSGTSNASPFQFGEGKTSNNGTSAATEDKSAAQDDDEDSAPKEKQMEDLATTKGPGEENEENVYEKRARVYEFKTKEDGSKAYEPIGLGTLRVLKHTETKKGRILLRAEGSGRVVINILLRPEITYALVEPNNVRVLDFLADGTGITYLLRVKTADDAKMLSDVLESNKGSE
ncbi:hypothetical protein CANCADRAFT_43643 [Tortispora caseinolytica NRRL Y-17796]|uniref:RanBD1 domain-containing protein n=1 Tax=Tortispora caseinolytica NRRL Y-17796 TaxID=767744 RepID=A0A1E4TDX9_9ASCO|nr:hypothetical protein CANCADRAFT_43643 [Tortispora caseinolytica NRRL Y-17796]